MIPEKLIKAYAEAKGWTETEDGPTAEDFVIERLQSVAAGHIADCQARVARDAALADVETMNDRLGLPC